MRFRHLLRTVRRSLTSRWPGSTEREPVTDGGTATVEQPRSQGGVVTRILDSRFFQSLPFWLPPAILVGFFVYGAIGWNLLISLTNWDGLGDPTYGSLDFSMYAKMFSDPLFWRAAKNTVVLIVGFTVACLVVGLLLAILIDRGIRLENTFRTIYLLPMSLSFVVTAKFWAWMYNPDNGLVNATLEGIGLDFLTAQWLQNPQIVLGAVIFALIWQFSGYAMVMFLAGLRSIPDEHYEAARVDGASTLKMYWRVIIPQLRASTVGAAVVLMVFALKAFDFIYVMFGKNPGPGTDILAVMMYRESFASLNWAYGSAIAIILFVMALAIIAPYLYSQYRRGEL
jgi:glucose/mannose transport system permease protein